MNFDSNQYRNLIIFSFCDLLFGIPITVFYLYINIAELVPYPGLKQEHSDFSYISQIPAVLWRAGTLSELSNELNRWIIVWGAFVFFAIFGFTEESRNNYRAMLQFVFQVFVKITGIKTRPQASSKAERCVVYIYISVHRLICMLFSIVFHNSHNSSTLLGS